MKNLDNIKQKINEEKENFHKYFQEFFDKEPRLNSFGWRQYTGEDGFSAYIDTTCLIFNGNESYDAYENDNEESFPALAEEKFGCGRDRINPNYDEKVKKLIKDISRRLSSVGDEIFMAIFGDYSEITIYKDRTEVKEYYVEYYC